MSEGSAATTQEPSEWATCIIPDCTRPLHICYLTSQLIYRGQPAEDLRPEHAWTVGWYVECESGHRIAASYGGVDVELFDPKPFAWASDRDSR